MNWGIALGRRCGESFYYHPYIPEMKCPQSRRRNSYAAIRECYDPLGLITTCIIRKKRSHIFFSPEV